MESVAGTEGPLQPLGYFSAEFQAQGKPPIVESLAINHPRVRLQFTVGGFDQQSLVQLPGVPHKHTEPQRTDVLGRRAFPRRRLLETGDPYGNGQPSPFFKSSRPHRHLVTHFPNGLRNRGTRLGGAGIPNCAAQFFTPIILCNLRRLRYLSYKCRLCWAGEPASLLLVHRLIGAHHPLSDRSVTAVVDSHRAQAEVQRKARFSGTDSLQIISN